MVRGRKWALITLEFLDCGRPGWVLVTDSNGNFCWVNEDEQLIEQEPPNLTELKEQFQNIRKEYVKKKNQDAAHNQGSWGQTGSQSKPSDPKNQKNLEPKTRGYLSPEPLADKSTKNSAQTPVAFELTTTEPRQTYEQSQAKLDPRQALFESKENTHKDLIEDFVELESGEEDLEDEESNGEDSQDLLKAKRSLVDSNYMTFKQLQKELNDVKEMYNDLEAENKALKGANERLSFEKEHLIKKQDSRESIEVRQPDSPRFNLVGDETSANQLVNNTNGGLADELKQIKALLKENLKIQSESLEKQKRAALEQKTQIQSQLITSSAAPNQNQWKNQSNPYRLPSNDDLKSSSDKQSSEIKIDSNILKGPKRQHTKTGSNKDALNSSQRLAESKDSKQKGFHSTKDHRKRSKETVSSNSLGHSNPLKQGQLSSLGYVIFRKWKDILGLEWQVLQTTAGRLEKERTILRQRKNAVQKYEWEMLWSIKDAPNEDISKKVLQDIKHVIFEYELDAEKVSLLTSLLDTRLKKLKIIEKSLDIGFKSGKIDQFADDHMTQLFNQYIDAANMYEYKLRINTSNLNPYKKSRFDSTLFSSLHKTTGQIGSYRFPSGQKSTLGDARTKLSNLNSGLDPQMSHLEFLKFTMSKVREGTPIEGSVFSEISTFFETQFAWFDTISEEIRVIMRRLDNPTNISALRRG
jgi:hypothetical protein